MKILYVASNPEAASPLQIEKEANLLREKLDGLQTSEPLDLRIYASLDVATLPDIILRVAPDILHFAAHGNEDGIVLAHKERGHVFLNGDMLADLLSALGVRPKLVVINACDSKRMANALVRAADFAIGTDAPISNVGARTMAATLYTRLADAASVNEAYVAAATMLRVIDDDKVGAVLYPNDQLEAARRVRLANPLRILASFPAVDDWLKHGHSKARKDFDIEQPAVELGLVGCPANVRQVQLFSDDETIQPRKGESLADARGWMLETTPVKGEIWLEESYAYYGDLQWYGSVTTTDRKILSTSASMADALERYYFVEAWRGEIPEPIAEVIRASILSLRENDGSRGGRDPARRPALAGKAKGSD